MSGEHFVIVDDEDDLLRSLASALQRSRPDAVVRAFADPVAAAAHLDEAPRVDALVTDIRMPRLDGIDLLVRARRRRPGLPAVIMTAFTSPALVTKVSSFGTVQYLDKPFSVATFTAAVDRVMAPPTGGFAGAMAIDGLPDLIQLCALSSSTSALRVHHGKRDGAIWFERGLVVHAEQGERDGLPAFFDILSWQDGEFAVERGAVARKRTIGQKATELLMEALRLQDEAIRGGAHGAPSAAVDELDLELAIREFDIPPATKEQIPMAMQNILTNLERLRTIDGYIGSCLVDSESGMMLGSDGGAGTINMEIAAAANTEVVRAKRKAMKALGLKDEIEDILITLGRQYHVIRPLRARPGVFYYVAVDRARANLAMARMAIADTEKALEL